MLKSIVWFNLAAVCLFAIGCSGGAQNPPTAPVTGKVTYKGQAVEGAAVKFVPNNSEANVANATTGADGTYALSTFESGDGAMAGSYKVSVRKLVSVQQGIQKDGEHAGEPAYVNRDMLPNKYKSANNTPLQFEVIADKDNSFDIDLVD